MANNNPANNLSEEDRRRGGQNTPSQFGKPKGADPSQAGSEGAKAEPHKAKVEGGKHSHGGGGNNR
jgi:uncharacterized protein